MRELKGLFYRDWKYDFVPEVIKESFLERIYDPYIKKDMVVVEIGANIGVFTLWAYEHASKIYAVEPSKEHFDTLMHMLTFNNMLDKVVPINKAISNEEGKATLYHSGNTTMYSLSDAIQVKEAGIEEVEMITLETLFKDIPYANLVNLDVEGFESRVLAGSHFDTVAPKIDTMIVEWHPFSGVTQSQLMAMLSDRGFRVSKVQTNADVFIGTK